MVDDEKRNSEEKQEVPIKPSKVDFCTFSTIIRYDLDESKFHVSKSG